MLLVPVLGMVQGTTKGENVGSIVNGARKYEDFEYSCVREIM